MSVSYDPRDPAILHDPFPVYRRLQDQDPVHWCPPLRGWIVTRYEDCRRVLNDPRFSADRLGPFFAQLPAEERARVRNLEASISRWSVFLDPPSHTRLRRLLAPGFTSRALVLMERRVAEIVDGLLDSTAGRGEMEFIADFAYPLPASVVMVMLGVALEDLDRFKTWSDDLALFVGSAQATPDKYARAERATAEMNAYFATLIRARRSSPEDDLISELLRREGTEDGLDEAELAASCMFLLFAGHETTTNLLGSGLWHLTRHPEQMARLVAEPSLAEHCVEEVLRYDGPINAMVRIATEQIEIADRTIPEGARVFAMLNAANRDPRAFENAEEFDITRRPNRQIGFGHGIHFCLGAPLARLEGRIALARIVERLGEIECDLEGPARIDSLVLRGLSALPIRFKSRGHDSAPKPEFSQP